MTDTTEKSDASPDQAHRLGQRIAFGTLWIMATRLLVRGLGLINTLILARLLVPEDFGLVAIGITLMQLLQNLSDIGVSQTVIKFRDAGRNILDTLFTLSALRGIAVALILVLLSPFAELLFGDPRAASVLIGISIAPLLLGFKNPKFFEYERDLDFSKTFLVDAITKSASVIVAVSIALAFRTYWAIILGIIAGAFAETIVSYLLRPYRPRISFAAIRELIGFTGWLAGISFVVALNNKLDTLLMPKLAGTAATGAFYVGHQIADIPTEEVATPMARAIYPGLSTLQEKQDEMNRTFLRGVEVLGVIGLPAAIGCAFVAEDLVALLLGQKWSQAVPVLQIYGPAAALVMLFTSLQGYALARNMAKFILVRELAYFIFRTPLFIWAAYSFGLIGAIWATATSALFKAIICLFVYGQVSSKAPWEPLWQVRRSILACIAMSVWFVLLRPHVPVLNDAPLFVGLTTDIVIGASVYLSTLYVFWVRSGRPDGAETMALDLLKRSRSGE